MRARPKTSSFRLLLIALLLLTGCATKTYDCKPALRQYSEEYQARAWQEFQAIRGKAPHIEEMLDDYIALRDQVRACE